jgi:hypothetical protein
VIGSWNILAAFLSGSGVFLFVVGKQSRIHAEAAFFIAEIE